MQEITVNCAHSQARNVTHSVLDFGQHAGTSSCCGQACTRRDDSGLANRHGVRLRMNCLGWLSSRVTDVRTLWRRSLTWFFTYTISE